MFLPKALLLIESHPEYVECEERQVDFLPLFLLYIKSFNNFSHLYIFNTFTLNELAENFFRLPITFCILRHKESVKFEFLLLCENSLLVLITLAVFAVFGLHAFVETNWMPTFYYLFNYSIKRFLENFEITFFILSPWNSKDDIIEASAWVCL